MTVFLSGQALELPVDAAPYKSIVDFNAEEYDSVADSYREVTAVHAAQEEVHIEMGIGFLETELKVVADLGCAFGRDIQFWTAHGFEYHGIDASGSMLALARASHPTATFVQGDFVTTPIRPESCSAVWASSSLQHVPSELLPVVMANAAQALVTGGVFYANYRPPKDGVPKEGYLTSTEYLRTDGRNTVRRFVAHYSREEMIDAISASGLTVVSGRAYDEVYDRYNAEKAAYLPKKEVVFALKR